MTNRIFRVKIIDPKKWYDRILPYAAIIVSVAAIIVSVVAIIVSIVALRSEIKHGIQTRNHNRLSVKPALVYVTLFNPEEPKPGIYIENAGLGPAEIKYMKVLLDEEDVENMEKLTEKLISEKKAPWGENDKPQWTNISSGTFIKEGTKVPLFCIRKQLITDFSEYKKIITNRMDIKIKYCSMYDECLETIHKTYPQQPAK